MRALLVAAYSPIEPLGLLHLGGLARDLGWERDYHLVRRHDFEPLRELIEETKPDLIGFNIYTGNHLQTFEFIDSIEGTPVVVGGPHATYFPSDSIAHADFVVMSEGFDAFRRILTDEAQEGILPMSRTERFPMPDRERLYAQWPEYARSKIKSIIGMTGCPYRCTYCYNSSDVKDIQATPEVADRIAASLGMSGRLFPHNVRSVEDVVVEAEEIVERWPTEVVYFQDDVHGFDTKAWLPELAEKWPARVGIPYHAQMRWEMVVGKGGEERLDLVKKAGCCGLTLAIEAADHAIRKEVLDRGTPQEDMYTGMRNLVSRGLRVRTEQITALPYGATSEPSPVNLEADLSLIELNVDLFEKTGGPTMAWASTFAPYAGTKLGAYAARFGHYSIPDNHDVPDTFFWRSVLRFPRAWEGPGLEVENPDLWLEGDELDRYRDQNAALRDYFNAFCLMPRGHEVARAFLTEQDDFSPESLARFIWDHVLVGKEVARLSGARDDVEELLPYFACIPKPELLIDRYLHYLKERPTESLAFVLSTATRHHLYDEVLYTC